ncbi:hypothetical protein [Alicyclobacillus fastidiosus]|uniref:Uncharacterized protein n=1 Tax=Alicyclobacillus fastidiosus TaxID=392011 RepID=A0ABV5AFH1_9BACL|nr:hypothetical protein [Alicyclobacillus fastidiosus]WEH09641.1 hypothetical protein PYS47_23890 [Alicyclobacillus fastidiosus]
MEKFILSFVSLGLLLLAGFTIVIVEHGRSMAEGVGGLMMLMAMISAAAIDIRLRSPKLRKSR